MTDHVNSMEPAVFKISPIPFYHVGRDFFRAADMLRRDYQGFHGGSYLPYFFYWQAIENGLKAFLVLKGLTRDDLGSAPFGHDLSALLTRARQEGLDSYVAISPEDVDVVAKATKFYNSGNDSRGRYQYFDVSLIAFEDRPSLDLLHSTARLVADNDLLKGLYLTRRKRL